jgi:hypothetical protein
MGLFSKARKAEHAKERAAYFGADNRPELTRALDNLTQMDEQLRSQRLEPKGKGPAEALLKTLLGQMEGWVREGRMKPLEHQLPTEIIENIIVSLGELGRDNAKVADDFRNLFAANRRIRDIAYGALRRMDPSVSVYIGEMSLGSSDAAKLRSNLLRGLPYLHLRMDRDSERLRNQIESASPENLKALRGLSVELPYGSMLFAPSKVPEHVVDKLYLDQISKTFAKVHANGSEELTTKVAIPEVRQFGPEVLSFASQLAGAKGSKLGGIAVGLGHYYPQDFTGYADRMTGSVKELAAVVTKEGNHLKFIDLGSVPVSADAVGLLFRAADSTHSRLDTLILDKVRSLDGIGQYDQQGTLAHAIAQPQNPLRRLQITDSALDRGQIFALVDAALRPESGLRLINLRGSYLRTGQRRLPSLTLGDVQNIRDILQRKKPALHIEVY